MRRIVAKRPGGAAALHCQQCRPRGIGRGPSRSSPQGLDGLNVETGEFEDLVKAGVVDPAKVTRSALQNAASIAGAAAHDRSLVADKPEKASPRRRGRGRMGGMGGMGGMM